MKKKNTKLFILITILVILVLVLSGYIVYDKMISKSSNNDDTPVKDEETTKDSLVSKEDSEKDWVYNAEYQRDFAANSYYTEYNSYYSKDIVVPYINVKSDAADEANKELKTVLDKAINTFNDGVNKKIPSRYVADCNYTKYYNDTTISVIQKYAEGETDIPRPDYYIYNIDLKTGNKLSYKEVYKLAGFNSKNIEEKVKTAIKNAINELLSDTNSSNETSLDTYSNESFEIYKDSIKNNKIQYYLDQDSHLNIIVGLKIPFSTSGMNRIVTVK